MAQSNFINNSFRHLLWYFSEHVTYKYYKSFVTQNAYTKEVKLITYTKIDILYRLLLIKDKVIEIYTLWYIEDWTITLIPLKAIRVSAYETSTYAHNIRCTTNFCSRVCISVGGIVVSIRIDGFQCASIDLKDWDIFIIIIILIHSRGVLISH